jgi:hypothetical protein
MPGSACNIERADNEIIAAPHNFRAVENCEN